MANMITYLGKLLLYLGCALPCVTLIRQLWRRGKGSPSTSLQREVALLTYWGLLVALGCMTVFFNGGFTGEWGPVNLDFFYVMEYTSRAASRGNWSPFFINFLGNILMFVPAGFFPPLLWEKMTGLKTLLLGAGLSLCIELCQLPQVRSTDVDDLWLNSLGVLLGYGIYRGLNCHKPEFTAQFRAKKE